MKSISIIIPLKNAERKIDSIFEALEELKVPHELKLSEVVFVDDGSRDTTFASIVKKSNASALSVSIFTYKKSVGQKLAGKFGIANARAKMSIVIKPDLSNLTSKIARIASKLRKQAQSHIPALSVVMTTNNAQNHATEAIKSIMGQDFGDFELIVIDDASQDNTWQILQRFAKRSNKIKIIRNERAMGQAKSLNRAISLARADFIARIDARDQVVATRFVKQIKHLVENPKIVAVGAQVKLINKSGRVIRKKHFPTRFDQFYKHIGKFAPIEESTLMIARKRLPLDFDFYNETATPSHDFEFIFKLLKYGKVENLPEFLHIKREKNNASIAKVRSFYFQMLVSRVKGILFYGYRPDIEATLVTILQIIAITLLPIYSLLYPIIFRKSSLKRAKMGKLAYPIALDNILPLW